MELVNKNAGVWQALSFVILCSSTPELETWTLACAKMKSKTVSRYKELLKEEYKTEVLDFVEVWFHCATTV